MIATRSLVLSTVVLVCAGCPMNVQVDPSGYRCNPGNVCPTGYSCVQNACQRDNGDKCAGVTCTKASTCSGAKVTTYAGHCDGATGACVFDSTDTACANGCANGACVDACKGVTCDTAPSPVCVDKVRRSFNAPGTCNATTGSCQFTSNDVACVNGCANGVCVNQDPCQGVVCNTPPAAVCMGNVARTFAATGTCAAGTCSYQATDVTCPGGCANGLCVSPSAVFKQTGPRVKFAISALDIAPNSNGDLVVAVGDGGKLARWNGSEWAVIATPTTENLSAVHFVNGAVAWVVGSKRTVWTYRNNTVAAVANVPGSGSTNFVSVYGRSESNILVADDTGTWLKWNGSAWVSGSLPGSQGNLVMTSAYIDETNRERIGGWSENGSGQTVMAYRNPTVSMAWVLDNDNDDEGCDVIGPWVDVSLTPDVLCGKPSNTLSRHSPTGTFTTNEIPSLAIGNGVVGIAGGAGHASYVLTSSNGLSQVGALYRLARSGLSVPAETLLTTQHGEEHLSLNDAAGVVVADVRRSPGVNDIFHRGPSTNEAYDLGEDWAALSATSAGDLVLVSTTGDLALRRTTSPLFGFVRGPADVVAVAAEAKAGTGVLVVGTNASTAAGVIERYAAGVGFTQITTSAPGTTFNSVCRISDTEAYVVGTGGSIYLVNSTTLVASKMTSGTSEELLSVDCGAAGVAVACGTNGTVLKLANGSWSPATPAYPTPTARLAVCRLASGTVWAAGDNVFSRLDAGAASWSTLTARAGLKGLFVRAPTDMYGFTGGLGSSDVVRFDGSTWKSSFSLTGTLRSGVLSGPKVMLGGTEGLLVEGQ